MRLRRFWFANGNDGAFHAQHCQAALPLENEIIFAVDCKRHFVQPVVKGGRRRAIEKLLWRVGEQVRIALIDGGRLSPDRRIEAGGQSGFQLRIA